MGRSPKENAPCEFTISQILDSGYTSDDVAQMRKGTGLGILIVLGYRIRKAAFTIFDLVKQAFPHRLPLGKAQLKNRCREADRSPPHGQPTAILPIDIPLESSRNSFVRSPNDISAIDS